LIAELAHHLASARKSLLFVSASLRFASKKLWPRAIRIPQAGAAMGRKDMQRAIDR
jgi:hypothetical protein